MELYEITLHFPDSYGSLGHKELTLTSTEYFETEEKATKHELLVSKTVIRLLTNNK